MRSFSLEVKAQDVRAAIRVGLSVGLPLCLLYALGRLDIAVYAAFGALTSLYGHSESVHRRIETQVVVGVALVLTIAVAALYAAAQGPTWALGLLLAAVVAVSATLGAVMGWVPRGELFFILVLLVIGGIPLRWDQVPLAVATGAGGAAVAILGALLEPRAAPAPRRLPARLRLRAAGGIAALEARSHVIAIAVAVVGVLAAWLLALSLEVGHPFWAPITVAALMPALTSADAGRRTARLLSGTLGGVGFAALLFSAAPDALALVALIILLQAAAELFVARSYAVALFFICPLAIGMSNLGRGLPWPPLVLERLTEAALGTAVALVAIVVGRALLARAASPPRAERGQAEAGRAEGES